MQSDILNINNNTNTNRHNHASNANKDVDSGDGTTLHHMGVIIEDEASDIAQLSTREVVTIQKELDVVDLYLDAVTMTGKKIEDADVQKNQKLVQLKIKKFVTDGKC